MNCINRKVIWPHRSIEWQDKNEEYPVLVHCGKCIPCLSHKRQEWIFRLQQEHKHAKEGALFVTLTYDQKHMPTNYELDKKHVQNYLKRLRKVDGTNKIRYYLVGEYGSKSGRPHYHVLLFNAKEEHARAVWRDSKGNSIGIVHVGRVTAASIAYCTKYIIQPEISTHQKQKPFALMSRAYGIGGKYLDDLIVAWHKEDDRNYVINDGKKQPLPRFYKSKIWYHEDEKDRISKKSKLEALNNQLKEEKYYKKKHPKNWEEVMAVSRIRLLQKVKTKIQFSQTI